MRVLYRESDQGSLPDRDPDLGQLYPWPEAASGQWVRGMMVTSLDSAVAGPDGLSRSISSATDRQVLKAVRQVASAIVIGAQTFRSERYRPLLADNYDAAARAAAGLASAPQLVIVSATGNLPWSEDAFHSSTLPIVVLVPHLELPALSDAPKSVEVIAVPDQTGHGVDVAAALKLLADRGHSRVVCEGGPALLDQFIAHSLLDELNLSLSPMFAGRSTTSAGQLGDSSVSSTATQAMQLVHVLSDDDGFLYTRYVRATSA